MDAKPQRPMRNMRVNADENVAPGALGQPVIHQRNKSSPALSTMLGAAGLKAPAKRTAFGDVSNTVTGSRNVKDDGAATLKQAIQPIQKALPVVADKKPSFLKQASRPYSVSNLRGLLTAATGNSSAENVLKPGQAESTTYANSRKILTKRPVPTIFKDVTLPTLQEATTQSGTAVQLLPTSLPPARLSSVVGNQPETTTNDAANPHTLLGSDASLNNPEKPRARTGTLPSNGEVPEVANSDGVYNDGQGNVQTSSEAQSEREARSHIADAVSKLSHTDQARPVPHPEGGANVPTAPRSTVAKKCWHSQPLLRPEPEEYWEDEEEEENVDEEGYVTARSFRSRGENSTGGATTVLFPQLNQRIKREIEVAKQLVEAERTPEDIEDESFDTSMVAEYGEEIFNYMTGLEIKMLPNPHYMDNQAEIKWSMRTVLMDWVIQVHHRFGLLPETLFLTVNYIDRFLSCKIVSLGKLQLVGATAIFIAAKYEEINCPSVQEIVYMVDGGYTIDEILKAERFMLTMLQFELGWPGPMSFLRRISKADDYDLETRTLAKYFLEVTVMDEQFIGSPPSFIAAASHCLARLMLRKGRWTTRHIHYSNYTYSQLLRLLPRIIECCEQPRKHHAQVYQKYADKRYKRASIFVEGEMVRGFMLPSSSKDAAAPYATPFFDPSAWRHL